MLAGRSAKILQPGKLQRDLPLFGRRQVAHDIGQTRHVAFVSRSAMDRASMMNYHRAGRNGAAHRRFVIESFATLDGIRIRRPVAQSMSPNADQM